MSDENLNAGGPDDVEAGLSERINEKQAVAVAEWVGVENHYFANTDKIDGVIFNGNLLWDKDDTQYFWGTISNWLYSAEGQEALREKLLSEDRGIYEETGMVVISWADETVEEKDLLQAVLKMLEEGDKDAI